MKNYLEIEEIKALEVLDSRGNPTVQVTVELFDGSVGSLGSVCLLYTA